MSIHGLPHDDEVVGPSDRSKCGFNGRGEPIVCTPEDACRCFMGTDLDRLVVRRAVRRKDRQDPARKQDYADSFASD